MSIFGSGFGGFGRTKSPVELIAPTIIAKCPIIPKKSRKKACDFIRTVSDSGLKKGDVIGVHRIGGVYDHYGIYTGRGKVIHFSNEGSDFGGGQLGREGYNIVFNNCEHFAVWCKTGVKESSQVQKFFEEIGGNILKSQTHRV